MMPSIPAREWNDTVQEGMRGAVQGLGQGLGHGLSAVQAPFRNVHLPNIKIPNTTWSSNDEDYGQTITPPAQATTTPYEGSYLMTALVATQAFVAKHYAVILILVILCVAGVLLCAGLYLQGKEARDRARDVKEREWGVCRTVQDALRQQEQAEARKKPKMKYYPVAPHDLRKVVVYE